MPGERQLHVSLAVDGRPPVTVVRELDVVARAGAARQTLTVVYPAALRTASGRRHDRGGVGGGHPRPSPPSILPPCWTPPWRPGPPPSTVAGPR